MKRIPERLLSLLLALSLCVGAMPLTASAADGTEYRQTTLAYFSKVTNEYVTDSGYYSDDWFAGDPAERNDGLALLSAQLSAAATDDPSQNDICGRGKDPSGRERADCGRCSE